MQQGGDDPSKCLLEWLPGAVDRWRPGAPVRSARALLFCFYMLSNFRSFDAGPDPFGRTWKVEFRWLQTAISIRHADAVDCKFRIGTAGESQEKVIALYHPDLLALSERTGRPVSDPWCMKLAALHLKGMIETDSDMDKTLVTASLEDLERWNELLGKSPTTA